MPQRGLVAALAALLTKGPTPEEHDADQWLSEILLLASISQLTEVKIAAVREGSLEAIFLKEPNGREAEEYEIRDGDTRPVRQRTDDRVHPLPLNAATFIRMLKRKMKHSIQIPNQAAQMEFGTFATQLPTTSPITVRAYLYHDKQECSLNLIYHDVH